MGSVFHCLRFCVLRVLSPELAAPLLSFFLTDIPLLPGSPRRLSSRTVARGGQGPKQYLRVPSPQAPGQRASASRHSSQISRRECSRDSSVSIGGHPKGASHLALLSREACVCLWEKPWVFGRAPLSSLSPSQAHFQQPWLSSSAKGLERRRREPDDSYLLGCRLPDSVPTGLRNPPQLWRLRASLQCLAFHLVAPVTSQVAAEAAGYQTSNKQGNTQREGGRSLACSASLALFPSLLPTSPVKSGRQRKQSVSCFFRGQGPCQ